jgi:hypothetical protein
MVFNATFNNISVLRRNQNTHRKPLTCRKLMTNLSHIVMTNLSHIVMRNVSAISWQGQVIFNEKCFSYIMARTSYIQ